MGFWFYKACITKTNDNVVVTSVSEGKIIEIYNQGISQVIDAIQKLTVEIRTQKAEIETLSKENKLLNKRVKSLES